MQKVKRLIAIEKIIIRGVISSQEELLKKLKGRGIICTQATLSRNLRQLGVSRVPNGSGGYRYTLTDKVVIPQAAEKKLHVIPAVQEIIEARGLILIKTIPGNASATAFYIDNTGRYEIAGTIAGDDTILLIPRDGITVQQVHACLRIILPGLYDRLKKK